MTNESKEGNWKGDEEWVGFEPTISSAKHSRDFSRSLQVKVPCTPRMSTLSTHKIKHTHIENMPYKPVTYGSEQEWKISIHATRWRGPICCAHCWTAKCEVFTSERWVWTCMSNSTVCGYYPNSWSYDKDHAVMRFMISGPRYSGRTSKFLCHLGHIWIIYIVSLPRISDVYHF